MKKYVKKVVPFILALTLISPISVTAMEECKDSTSGELIDPEGTQEPAFSGTEEDADAPSISSTGEEDADAPAISSTEEDAHALTESSDMVENADPAEVSAEVEGTVALIGDTEDFGPINGATDTAAEEVSEAVPSEEGEEQGTDPQEPEAPREEELEAPQMRSAVSLNYRTVKITWSKVPEAKSYTLYMKKGDSWKKVASGIAKTSYKQASSEKFPLKTGKEYTYTVKAVYEEGSSAFAENPVSVTLLPGRTTLNSVEAVDYQALKLSWKQVGGAQWYGIYVMKPGGRRIRIGNTKATTYTHSSKNKKIPLKTGVKYTYSVRAFCKYGDRKVYGDLAQNTVSGKTRPEKAVLKEALCYEKGKIRITWKPAKGADSYLIFRKTKESGWEQIAVVKGGSKESYTHVSSESHPIKKGAVYWYTVKSRAAGKTTGSYNKTGKKVTATPQRYKWIEAGGNYYCYDLVTKKKLTGMRKINGKYYNFSSEGTQRVGWYRIDGAYYYFRIANGEKGYRLSSTKVNGIPISSSGKAVESTKVRLLTRANAIVNSVSDRSMSDEERLYECFVYAVQNFAYRDIGDFYAGGDWDEYYASYFLEYGYGDCFAAGAGFAYLAAAIGYSDACAVSSGGHGWAEVDGLVSDPDWAWAMNDIDGYFHISYSLSGVGGRPYYSGNRAYVKQVA